MSAITEAIDQADILAAQVYEACQAFDPHGRSAFAADFRVGISDIGTCREKTRRMILQDPEEPKDTWAAFVGSAVGDRVEAAVAAAYPEAKTQVPLVVTLRGEQGTFRVSGHADLLLPHMIIDVKSADGLSVVERVGPDRQQMFQRHLYAKAAIDAGLFTVDPPDVLTANIWVDRSGREQRFVADVDHYSEAVVAEATEWLDDAVYATRYGELASKDKPREWCFACCGFAKSCRAGDTDASGLIEDPVVLAAVEEHRAATAEAKAALARIDTAQRSLAGVNGSTGEWAVRWVHHPATEMRATKRRAYDTLSITPIKGN